MARWPKDSPGTWYSRYKRGSMVSRIAWENGPKVLWFWGSGFCLWRPELLHASSMRLRESMVIVRTADKNACLLRLMGNRRTEGGAIGQSSAVETNPKTFREITYIFRELTGKVWLMETVWSRPCCKFEVINTIFDRLISCVLNSSELSILIAF